MSYITLLDADETFTYRPVDPDGNQQESEFVLRIVPEAEQTRLRRKHETTTWQRGQRVTTVDWTAWAEDCLAYAIVDWRAVMRVRIVRDKAGAEVSREREPVPCGPDTKRQLPEFLKVEIIRLCVGREAGAALETEEVAKNG